MICSHVELGPKMLRGQEGQASIDLPLGDQLETHSPEAWFAADY
jgi:hypothetical protein